MVKYNQDIVLSVVQFTSQLEETEVVIGHPESGTFLAIPVEASVLLRQLASGKSIGESSEWFESEYGETPDLDDFISLLETKGFVSSKPFDEAFAAGSAKENHTNITYHFSAFPEQLAKQIFGPPALIVYSFIILTSLVCLAAARGIWPHASDWYFPDHRTISWTILLGVTYFTLFLHELSHLIAARALGVNSRLGIGHRLWFLVAETDLTGLWAVARRKRFLPLIAGVLLDAVSGAICLELLFVNVRGWIPLSIIAVRLIRAIAFMYFMRIVWQCLLYIRTDLYYVVATLASCRNLMTDTETFIKNAIARRLPFFKIVDQSTIPASERRIIRLYSAVWILGRGLAIFLLITVTVPIGMRYLHSLRDALNVGYEANPEDFIDSLLTGAYFFVPLVAGITLWVNSLLRRQRSQHA